MTTEVLLSYAPQEAHPGQDVTPLFSEASFPPLQISCTPSPWRHLCAKKEGTESSMYVSDPGEW